MTFLIYPPQGNITKLEPISSQCYYLAKVRVLQALGFTIRSYSTSKAGNDLVRLEQKQ